MSSLPFKTLKSWQIQAEGGITIGDSPRYLLFLGSIDSISLALPLQTSQNRLTEIKSQTWGSTDAAKSHTLRNFIL